LDKLTFRERAIIIFACSLCLRTSPLPIAIGILTGREIELPHHQEGDEKAEIL
jgi:hypothetical protein